MATSRNWCGGLEVSTHSLAIKLELLLDPSLISLVVSVDVKHHVSVVG